MWILPVKTIFPQIAHQLCRLFQARVPGDLKIKKILALNFAEIKSPTHISLCSRGSLANLSTRAACEAFIGRLTWRLTFFQSKELFHPTHLPKYLIGESLHLGGILGVAASRARVGIKLGGLWWGHSSSHLLIFFYPKPVSNPSCHGT